MALVRVRWGQTEEVLGWDEFESRVRAGRVPADAEVYFAPLTGTRWLPAGELAIYQSLRHEAPPADAGRFGALPILTALLLGVQIRIWWFAQVPEFGDLFPALFASWASAIYEGSQVWRLVTAGFVHVDGQHIAGNSLWFVGTGLFLERALGRANLATIFLASVFGGYLLSMLFSPFAWSLGSSGGVFGMIAATFVTVLLRSELIPARRRWFALLMLPYMVVMFRSGLSSPQVDNWAHLGGLVTGAVLGGLLGPDASERWPGRNRRVRWGVLAVAAAVMLCLGGLGPRIEPLLDEQAARIALRPRREGEPPPRPVEDTRAAVWEVPAGWRTGGDAVGARGYTSTLGSGDRVFTVNTREEDRVVTAQAAVDRWNERLRKRVPGVVIDPPAPVLFAGLDGLRVVAHLPGSGPAEEAPAEPLDPSDPRSVVRPRDPGSAEIELRVVTRGVQVLEGTWQVETRRGWWLAPLADRLWATVEWRESRELVAARAAVEARPANVDARLSLARELARGGDAEGADRECRGLLDAAPADPARWETCLEVARISGTSGPALEEVLARALAASPIPKTVAAVARTLEADGQAPLAAGLLDIAWAGAPGDTVLKRARRGLALSTALDRESGEPWAWARDPVSGRARGRDERARLAGYGLTIADARAVAAWQVAERARVVAAAVAAIEEDDGRAAFVPLSVLQNGAVVGDDADATGALVDDLHAAIGGRTPEWMPAQVASALAAHPDLPSRLR